MKHNFFDDQFLIPVVYQTKIPNICHFQPLKREDCCSLSIMMVNEESLVLDCWLDKRSNLKRRHFGLWEIEISDVQNVSTEGFILRTISGLI